MPDMTPDQPEQTQGMQDLAQKYAPGEASAAEGFPYREQYGKNAGTTKLIPEKYQNIFKELCRKASIRDQFARIEEVKKAAEQRFYWRSMFDVCWNEQESTWEQPTLTSGVAYGNNSGADSGDVSLHYPINIYQQYGRGHITVVSEPWKIRMEARKVNAPDMLRISSAANTMMEKIEAQNYVKDLRMAAARLSWTDGRVSFYSRWVTDGARFGYEDETHDEETMEGVGEADTPPEKSPRQPKGGEVVDAYGVLECKVPINMRQSSQFMFRQLAYEIDITAAKSMFPWIAKRINAGQTGPGEYNFDRTTRIATTQGVRILQQIGDTIESLPTWERNWFRPSFFAEIGNDEDRKWFEDNYPDGACVEFVGSTYCCSRNESMDDHWVDIHPLPGDGQATPSCGYILMAPQDALLDLTDLKMERAMKSIPAIWCNKNAGINLQAISKEKAGPGAHYGIELGQNQIAEQQFWSEPTPQAPADESEMWSMLFSTIPQSLTGLYPAAIGESDPSNSTLGGIKLLQAASKGQSGVAWCAFREGYAKSMMQLVRIGAYYRAADADEEGKIRVDDITVDLEDLHDGNWACVPDGDESYPNTHSERKEALQELLAQPWSASLMTIPSNMALAKDLLGLNDAEIPGADIEEKEMGKIKIMLEEPPIPNIQILQQYKSAVVAAALQGQPAPPQPSQDQLFETSCPIDPEVDDSAMSYVVLKNWLNSAEGQQTEIDNKEGYLNIRLRMLAHKAQNEKNEQVAIQKQQQQMLLAEAAKHPPKAPKDASESISINYKDLGASGKIQAAAKVGIDVTADEAAELAASHMGAGKTTPKPPNPAKPAVQ